MSCEPHTTNLSAYLDGALSEEELRATEEHLAGCLACQTERDALAQVSAQVGALPRLAAPPEFAAALMAKLGEAKAASDGSPPLRAKKVESPCETLSEDLSALLDHHIKGQAATKARTHLADCEDCRARQTTWQRLRDRVGALPKLRVPAEFLAGIMAKIEQIEHEKQLAQQKQREARITLFSTIGKLAQAAAILAVVGGGLFMTSPAGNGRTSVHAPFGGPSGKGSAWKKVSSRKKEDVRSPQQLQPQLPEAQAKLELSVSDLEATKQKTIGLLGRFAQRQQSRVNENSAEFSVELPANQVDDLYEGLAQAQVETNELADLAVSELHSEQDRVVLKNGFVLVGQILGKNRSHTRVRCGNTIHEVLHKDVERVERANETRKLRIVLHKRD